MRAFWLMIYGLCLWFCYCEDDCSVCTDSDWKCGDIKSTASGYNTCIEDSDAYDGRTSCAFCCAIDEDNFCYCKDSESECAEMTAWLWWLVAALVIFLCMCALLVYKYWWKQKKVSNELDAAEVELDELTKENEMGFGADLDSGFNPMATGSNPNDPATR